MPEVAANAVEAVLQEWPVAENVPFSAADTIATVETEKAVVDVEAETDGVILKILVPAGAAVEVGAPIAVLGEPGEKVDDPDGLLARLGVAPPTTAAAPQRRTVEDPPQPAVAANGGGGATERLFVSPLARRMAREAGLSIEQIIGTGPGGRIIRRDVEAAIANQTTAAAAAPAPVEPAVTLAPAATAAVAVEPVPAEPATSVTAASAGPAPAAPAAVAPAAAAPTPAAVPAAVRESTDGQPAYVDQPHSRMRKAIAARLTGSKQTAPHFYVRGTARVDKLLKLRERLNEVSPTRISVNDLVIKAVAAAHVMVPAMNVVWTPDAVRSYSSVDISVAVATERGLVTPVLRSVERMSISQVAAGVQDFVARAKAGRLRQDELDGGSLSVTNLGMYGTEEFAAIINPPQAAILAVGAARQEPVVRKGKLTVGTVLRVTLSVDHRPVDGVVAAQWMKAFVSLLENPLKILV